MVDAALGTPTQPVPDTSAPQSQVASLPPLNPPTPPTPDPEPTPAPVVAPVPPMAPPTMGDDTPLAFAAAPTMPSQPEPSSLGTSVPMDAMPSAPISETPKPKSMKSKMVGAMIGIMLLVLGVGGGLWGYNRYRAEQIKIAVVTGCAGKGGDIEACYLGTAAAIDKQPVLEDKIKNIVFNPTKDPDYDTQEEKNTAVDQAIQDSPVAAVYNAVYTTADRQLTNDETNIAQNVVKLGGSCNGLAEGTVCDNSSGVCTGGVCVASVNTQLKGLCGTLFDGLKKGDQAAKDNPLNPCKNGTCTLTPELAGAGCIIQNVKCAGGGQSGVACEDNVVAEVADPNKAVTIDDPSACGSQQVDVICKTLCGNTQPLSFASRISGKNCSGTGGTAKTTTITENPSPSPSPSPLAPTMACTGLTHTPTAVPEIGDKLTFTCAGTVTPPSAGTLSYKFRYSINSGAVAALTNKTTTTAELNIAACGSYKVECQACATLNGVLTCDPLWTGATQ